MGPNAQALVIGTDGAGCGTAHHLARLGATDALVVDRGPLPATDLAPRTAPSPTMSKKSLAGARDIVQPGPWAGRYWSPIVGAEQRAIRERVAMCDMTSPARTDNTCRRTRPLGAAGRSRRLARGVAVLPREAAARRRGTGERTKTVLCGRWRTATALLGRARAAAPSGPDTSVQVSDFDQRHPARSSLTPCSTPR
ncbi:hypothetical protein GCM10025787_46810 [Saccharopolyspora rosea]